MSNVSAVSSTWTGEAPRALLVTVVGHREGAGMSEEQNGEVGKCGAPMWFDPSKVSAGDPASRVIAGEAGWGVGVRRTGGGQVRR